MFRGIRQITKRNLPISREMSEAIQAREASLKDKQIELGKEIQNGSDNADKVHDMVDCHEYRLEMMAAFQPSFMVEK